jgi:hypothetical protein
MQSDLGNPLHTDQRLIFHVLDASILYALGSSLLHTLLAAASKLSIDNCGNKCGESLAISQLPSLLVKPLIGGLDFHRLITIPGRDA